MSSTTMVKTLFSLGISFFMLSSQTYAQCPNQNKAGIHVVQAKQNLYRISKMYGVEIADLCKFNNISINQPLSLCQELIVSNGYTSSVVTRPATMASPTTFAATSPTHNQTAVASTNLNSSTSSYSTVSDVQTIYEPVLTIYKKQGGNQHVVQKGETVAGLARVYGYTEERFRTFNGIKHGVELAPGSVILSSDSTCGRIAYNDPTTINYIPTPVKASNVPFPINTNVKPVYSAKDLESNNIPSAPAVMNLNNTAPQVVNSTYPANNSKIIQQNTVQHTQPTAQTLPPATYTQQQVPATSTASLKQSQVQIQTQTPTTYSPSTSSYQQVSANQNSGVIEVEPQGIHSFDNIIGVSGASYTKPYEASTETITKSYPVTHNEAIYHQGNQFNTGPTTNTSYNANLGVSNTITRPNLGTATHSTTPAVNNNSGYNYRTAQPASTGATATNNNMSVMSTATKKTITPPSSTTANKVVTKPAPLKSAPASGTAVTKFKRAVAPYMEGQEVNMLDEINFMRSNPKNYIQFVQKYVDKQPSTGGFPINQAAVTELIEQLKRTPKLSNLAPIECLYDAAKKHGRECFKRGDTDHQGLDGKWPWDRVRQSCPQMMDGKENLVGGPSSIRDAVIILLIDDGIPNRGHRNTLLDPVWKYGATYYIGKVGSMPNCWVQKFGY